MLKYFLLWFQFRRDIRMCKHLLGIIDTAESDSGVIDTQEYS